MIDLRPRQRIRPDKPVELLPGEGFALTASIEPLEQDAGGDLYKLLHPIRVERHAVISDMSPQLGAEASPDNR